jgi:A/G-specific adenine glycosylase
LAAVYHGEKPSQSQIEAIRTKLLAWFRQYQRDLPWRRDRDPYKIWVSEVMLQQTKVDTVVPYFERFISAFPSLEALADAGEEEVLKHWEGLGYYSRVRHLHAAVREVRERYNAQVPKTPEQLLSLKGVGSYTAGAILSIAYGQAVPAVDGNVMRVVSRLLLIEDDIAKPKTKKKIETLVQLMIPKDDASFFNQALMELGALVCRPKQPDCVNCPLLSDCAAYKTGRQTALPVKSGKRTPRFVEMVSGMVINGKDEVLLHQRPQTGLLAGLWQFPTYERKPEIPREVSLSRSLYEAAMLKVDNWLELSEIEHVFTHLRWSVGAYLAFLPEPFPAEGTCVPEPYQWVGLSRLKDYTLPVVHQKIVKAYEARYNKV